MWQHVIKWRRDTQNGTLPEPTLVTPQYKRQENIFKTAAGARRRKVKGIWAGVQIAYEAVEPSELAGLDAMLAQELLDSDALPFEISVDNGATWRRAHLARDIAPKALSGKNIALGITLDFDYTARLTGYMSPLHLGAGS